MFTECLQLFCLPNCSLGMSETVLLPPTAAADLISLLPVLERVYGSSSSRLVSTHHTLTSDIIVILSSSQRQDSFVEVVRESVSRQVERYGCGGRTVALWTCLFYKLLQDLKELGSGINSVVELALEHCISGVWGVSVDISNVPLSELSERLSHGIEHHQLVNKCCELPQNNETLANTLSRCVTVAFEKSSAPSLVLEGSVISSPDGMLCGEMRVLLVGGDIAPQAGNLGYKGLVKESVVSTPGVSSEQDWNSRVLSLLERLDVQVVLATGLCRLDVVRSGIVVVPSLSYDVLLRISGDSQGLLPSVEFATPRDVKTLQFEKFNECLTVIKSCQDPYYTILVRNPVQTGSANRYKTYLARLQSVLKCGVALPGGGFTERFCSESLSSFVVSPKERSNYHIPSYLDTSLVAIVSSQLSALFSKVASLTENNAVSNHFDFSNDLSDLTLDSMELVDGSQCLAKTVETVEVYDDLSSKVGAWRLALETAKVLDSLCLSMKPRSVDKS